MMADAMQKFASYFVLAALFAIWWSRSAAGTARVPVLAITLLGVSLSALIEFAQVFIPVRVPSLTDPILAAAGCLAGAVAQRHAGAFYHFARTQRPACQTEIVRQPLPQVTTFGPNDALIATLFDPYPDAPVEPSPESEHTHTRSDQDPET
jgi:hypothetical protein